ncbi:MAG: phosphotransferase family protein [Gemmatimonadaceae bacterium]
MRRGRRPDETPEDDGWVVFGDQRILPMGFTEGGAPYGITEAELDEAVELERRPLPNWADAKDVLCEVARRAGIPPRGAVIGRIRRIGDGVSNVVFSARIQLGTNDEIDVVIKLPAPDSAHDRDARMRAEAALLRFLRTQDLPFVVPRPLDEVETNTGLAVVQEFVEGFDVDLRAARFRGGKPWEFVAKVAAAVHAIKPDPVCGLVRVCLTRVNHALAFAGILEELDGSETRDTDLWIRDHLPPPTAGSLLHGDLLGQNLRSPWDDLGAIGVLDWTEACVGDPAYDLAIVTRGHRKPFAVASGLERLVEAYNRLAPSPLAIADVRIHELLLHAHLCDAAMRHYGPNSAHAEQQRLVWRSLLRRAAQEEA